MIVPHVRTEEFKETIVAMYDRFVQSEEDEMFEVKRDPLFQDAVALENRYHKHQFSHEA